MNTQRSLLLQRAAERPCARDESSLVRLAAALGRPVARRHLNLPQANAAVLVHCVRSAREGRLPGDPIEAARIAQHIVRLHADNVAAQRQVTIGAIRRSLRPLIGIGAPPNRLRAEAHDENGCRGFPLAEGEVDEIVAIEIWSAKQTETARDQRSVAGRPSPPDVARLEGW